MLPSPYGFQVSEFDESELEVLCRTVKIQVGEACLLPKMLSVANTFEIGDIQEDESEAALARRSNLTILHWVENAWMEFSRSTG
jgi:hypothetical protein